MCNFRCYKDTEFELDDVTLISAESGAGKSSILLAVLYALYGTKTKSAKLVAYEASSCSVTLELEDMVITRSSSPARVTLTDSKAGSFYEGAEAQAVINAKFGNCFAETSFVTQNPLNAFIVMKPTEKLEFLERFAFKDANIPALKEKTRLLCHARAEEALKAEEGVKVAREILSDTYPTPQVLPVFPFKCKPDLHAKYTDREKTRLKNAQTLLRRATANQARLTERLEKIRIFKAHEIGHTKAVENALRRKLSEIGELDRLETACDNTPSLSSLQSSLKKMEVCKEISRAAKQVETDRGRLSTLSDSVKAEIADVESQLSAFPSKEDMLSDLESLEAQLADVISYRISNAAAVEAMKKLGLTDLDEASATMEAARASFENAKRALKAYSCPCCDARLFLENGLLVSIQGENNMDSAEAAYQAAAKIYEQARTQSIRLKDCNAKCEAILGSYEPDSGFEDLDPEDVKTEIANSREMLNAYSSLKRRLKELKDKSRAETLLQRDLEFSISDLSEHMARLQVDIDNTPELPPYNEEQLRDLIQQENTRQVMMDKLRTSLSKTQAELVLLESDWDIRVNAFQSEYGMFSEASCEKELVEVENQAELHRQDINKAQTALDCITAWNQDCEKYNKYIALENRVKELEVKFGLATRRHLAAQKFRQDLNSAESIASARVIDDINTHAKLYLDSFFEEEPISVQLSSFREGKNKQAKPQIAVQVVYKGCEAELESLSGGELSRVILAFTLALSEMVNSPLLLLDECTANLNQELTSKVFDVVKEHSQGKTVLVVAHQVVEGVFDNVLKL